MSENTIQQILSAARLLFQPGDVVEVRVPKARKFRVIAGYFDDFQLLAEAAAALDQEGYAGIYWTLNQIDPALLARGVNKLIRYVGQDGTTADKYVVHRRLLLIDCDPERPPEISSSEEEHQASLEKTRRIREALLAAGWPEPLHADSGNGGHLVYRIDLPNDKESANLLSQCLHALAARFDDPEGAAHRVRVDKSVFNASRISKVYGTMARKGDHTADRPHRVSRVLEVPALFTPVPIDLLQILAAQAPSNQKNAPKALPRSGVRPIRSDFDLREFLDRHGIRYRNPVPHDSGTKYTLFECPFDASHKAKDAAVFERPDGYGFKCFHSSCADRGWREFRELFEPDAYSRRVAGGQHSRGNPAHPASSEIPPEVEESVGMEELLAMVFDAIERGDHDGVNLMVPEIAKLSATETLRIKTRMGEKFGRKFKVRAFEAAIREERRRGIGAIAGFAPDDGLPAITVNNRAMRDVVADALAALRASNDPPFLFVRSGEMIFVEIDERQRPSIQGVEKAHLRGRLDRAANFIRKGDGGDIAVPPPLEVVEDILALPCEQWGVPPLEFVVEVPTLRSDGTILSSPGYDPISRMLYAPAPDFKMDPIPEVIDSAELEAAVILVDEAIYDFPFAQEKDDKGVPYPANPSRANFFGLLLTPIVRPAISGTVPMCLIDAPQAGTGKSLLADLFSVITTGRNAAMMPFPRNEEEVQKSIGSTLLAGGALVCFDNVEGILNSPTLALVLTAKEYQARILGVSENMIAANRATWLATGNNIRPSGDMPRRCYTIRLDAKRSRPFQGRDFKHENLLEWAHSVRAQLLRALLIIARAWYGAEIKPKIADAWGSFEDWHRTIGGILQVAQIDGFLSNLKKFLEEGDDMALQWETFLGEIEMVYELSWFKVNVITKEVRESSATTPSRFTVPDSLADVDRRKEGGFEKALGKSFAKRIGTRFGDQEFHLERRIDPHTKQSEWRVLTKDSEAAAIAEAAKAAGKPEETERLRTE